jgi:hypothetical protein
VVDRYFAMFGMPPFSSGASVLKLVVLAAFVASAGVFFGMAKFRGQRGYRALMGLFLIHVTMLAVIDGFKQSFYQVYVEPLWIAVLAVVAVQAWRMWPRARWVVATALAAVLMVQLSVAAGRWRSNPFGKRFLPAVGFVQANAVSGKSVMASSEMGLKLGFTPALIDDYRLGYRTGKRADLIVMDEARYQPWIELLAGQDPGNYAYIQRMLREDYRVVYDRPGYRIFQRVAPR